MHRLLRPPPQEHEHGHPPQRELDAEVDRAAARKHGRNKDLAVREVVVDGLEEEEDRDHAVCREGHDRQQDKAEPSGSGWAR